MKKSLILILTVLMLSLPFSIYGFGGGSSTYSIGFGVEGLNGSLTLANNGDTKKVTNNGSYTFAALLNQGSTYDVKVTIQPAFQQCSVARGKGTVGSSNVTNIKVTCVGVTEGGAPQPHTVSGTVTGARGSLVIKKLSWVDSSFNEVVQTVPANGSFSLKSMMKYGSTYIVTIDAAPDGQRCTVTNGSGTVSGETVTTPVTCTDLAMSISFKDQNWNRDYIEGSIHITRAPDESSIRSYVLRYGGCSEFGYNQICKLEQFAELPKTGFDLVYDLPKTYLFTQARRFLLLQTKNNSGQLSSNYVYVGKKVSECPIFNQSCGIDINIDPSETWGTAMGTEQVHPDEILYPSSMQYLIDTLKRAHSQGKRVRMTGSGLSPSDVAITKDILLRPLELNSVLRLDTLRLKNVLDPFLVRVQSGTTIKAINAYLDSQNLAMPNLGGYDGQTIAGVMMTATHGSGLKYGPISDFVESLQVVGENGKVYQIEPTKGITNPAAFPGTLEEDKNIKVQLIQNDDTFNAMKVSVGSMGVVYSITIRAHRKFWIHEERKITTWNKLKAKNGFLDRLLRGVNLKDSGEEPEYYEFQVSPYLNKEGERTVLITERWKSYTKLREDNPHLRGQIGNEIGTQLLIGLQEPLVAIMNAHPDMIPETLESALKIQADDNYENLSYKVFHIGEANHVDVSAIELAFDLKDTISAMERLFEVANNLKARNIYQSVPFAGRFVKSSDSLIAMMEGRNTLMVEIIVLNGLNGQQELFRTYQDIFTAEFNMRSHWGLDMNFYKGQEWPKRLYPQWNKWVSIYQQFNQGTFDGKFTDRLGISRNPR